MAHLVLVEDDERIAAPLVRALTREGYVVEHLDHGLPAIERVARGDVDLVLLDLGLPDVDGLDVCRALRERGVRAGILVLTARDHELDLVVGLDSGADDYLAKPFALAELLARTRALLRRGAGPVADPGAVAPSPGVAHSPGVASSPGVVGAVGEPPAAPASPAPAVALRAGGVGVDRGARRAWAGGTELALTPKEFELLALLVQHAGSVVTREHAIGEVWDRNWFGPTRMLDATLGRLRQKLDEAGAPDVITTVRGVGFRLDGALDGAGATDHAGA